MPTTITYPYPYSYTAAPVPVAPEPSSKAGIAVAIVLVIVVALVVYAVTRGSAGHLESHAVHVTPAETALASAVGPLSSYDPLSTYSPYAISANPSCVVGTEYYPSCLTQTPVQYFTSGDLYCTAGSLYWPLCRRTSARPLPAMKF